MKYFYVIIALLIMFNLRLAAQTTLYVTSSGSGNQNGSSWSNAATGANLQTILDTSTIPKQIWLAAGTYVPGATATNTFNLKNNTGLYGGFVGSETSINQRNPGVHQTILSGNGQCYHVVTASGVNTTAILDGFIVRDGSANGLATNANAGGGMICLGSSPIIRNCVFTANTGTLVGAINIAAGSSPLFINCIAYDNHCGINNYMIRDQGSSIFVNCTIAGNTASLGTPTTMQLGITSVLINCIVYGNQGNGIVATSGNANVTYSIVQGGYTGTGNSSSDPLFRNGADADGADNRWMSDDDGLQLKAISPALNAGNNTPVTLLTDIAGNIRIRNGLVDVGAYEFFVSPDANGILYVKQGSTANGASWANALGEAAVALKAAATDTSIKQIWVSGGTYKPMFRADDLNSIDTNDRNNAFLLTDSLRLYGGFAGTETSLAQRNLSLSANTSILSGDIGIPDDSTDNTYHVVIGNSYGYSEINGFTVTRGQADGDTSITVNYRIINQYDGAGMINRDAVVAINNMVFTHNNAANNGGAMYNINSSYTRPYPAMQHITFSNNHASYGGGMYNLACASVLTDVTFNNNSAVNGGGMAIDPTSSPVLSHVNFIDNTAVENGGGVYTNAAAPYISHAIFKGNTAKVGGGMEILLSKATIDAAIFENNTATTRGGGIEVNNFSFYTGQISNTIIRNNTCINRGGGVALAGASPFTFINVLIEGNTASTEGGIGVGYETVLINTTIVNNTANGRAGLFSTMGIGAKVRNCIIHNNRAGTVISNVSYSSGAAPDFSNCLIQNSGGSASWNSNYGLDGGGNIDADPLFINVSQGDFRLQGTSPCINAGGNGYNTSIIDMDGRPRKVAGVIDMGAYEKTAVPDTNGIVYVKKGNDGLGNSWANAIPELADALRAAKTDTGIHQIWVAAGTYMPVFRPDSFNMADSSDRNNAFLLVKDVKVYGSFAGTETSIAQRVLTAPSYTSILSGDLGVQADSTDNAYHVVVAADSVGNAGLNGFTISGGRANGASNITVNSKLLDQNDGAGMVILAAAPDVAHVHFTHNSASDNGGGALLYGSSATMKNLRFSSNQAAQRGGGLYVANSAAVQMDTLLFLGNRAHSGGGAGLANSSFTFNNSIFEGNIATLGGGQYIATCSPANLDNTTFKANTATERGGAIFITSSLFAVSNNLFTGNTASEGGALYVFAGGISTITNATFAGNSSPNGSAINSASNPTVYRNCLFYGNTGSSPSIYGGAGTPNFTYCLIQQSGGSSSWNNTLGNNTGGNIDANPLFVNAAAGNYRLQAGSPAINMGNNSLVTATRDLDGNIRITGSSVDIGAYEYFVPAPLPLQLISFTGKTSNEKNLLTWKTSEAYNTDRFEITRSADGRSFEEIGRLPATESLNNEYHFADELSLNGANYYRLRILDNDGSIQYSNTVLLHKEHTNQVTLQLFPNPADDYVSLRLNGSQEVATAELYDTKGLKVASYTFVGGRAVLIPLQQLHSGAYLIRVVSGPQLYTARLVVR